MVLRSVKWHRKLPIRRRLFASLLLVSMLPVLLITYLSVQTLYTSLHDQIIQSGETSIEYLQDRLESFVYDFETWFYELEVDSQFKGDIITWSAAEKTPDYSTQWRLISTLNAAMSVDSRINSIELHNLCNGQVLSAKRSGAELLDNEQGYRIWEDRDKNLQTNVAFQKQQKEMLIMHQMNQFETGRALAVIVIKMRYRAFEHMLEFMNEDEQKHVVLMNDENKIIFSGQEEDIEQYSDMLYKLLQEKPAHHQQVGDLYAFYRSIDGRKLQAFQVIPKEIIRKAASQTLNSGLLVGALSLITAVALSIVLSRVISNPIISLANTMKSLKVNDFEAQDDIVRQDEIGLLQSSFNHMVLRNQDLIYREYQSSIEKHRAQLQALQAQINPHFLHNTLQVIGGMALTDQSSDIYDITIALSDMMRYSLDFSNEMVSIRDELKYIKSYINIQNQRFENQVSIQIDIPNEILRCKIPKLILQPIVENSFEHGFKNTHEEWVLRISGRWSGDGDIQLAVSDNGKGVSSEEFEALNAVLSNEKKVWSSNKHIGLPNINARIKLRYGEEYGVSVKSKQGKGTIISILVKAIEEDRS